MEYVGRSEQRQGGVLMMIVVPVEELSTPGTCLLEVAEAPREVGLVLQRLELCLREGVVVGHARSTVTGINTEFAEQIDKAVCGHRCCPAQRMRAAAGLAGRER